VTWLAQNFEGPKLWTLGDQQYFVCDTAPQSIKLLDMLNILFEHGPLVPLGYAYVQCNYFISVERHFRSKASDLEETVNMN